MNWRSSIRGALLRMSEIVGHLVTTDKPGMPNLPVPTLGGVQVWADEFIQSGWRIQENILTGHYRLLDPENIRQAWGTYGETMAAFRLLKESGGVAPQPEDLVIFIHGLGGWGKQFFKFRDQLERAGYSVENINYPSTRRGIHSHAEQIDRVLNRMEGVRQVTFVSHSMGGLVMRLVLDGKKEWRAQIDVDGIVMIGAPNKGAALADALANTLGFDALTTQAGQDLRCKQAQALPPVAVRYCLIAGSTNGGKGINPLIPGDDDGLVAVAEVPLTLDDDLLVIESDHLGLVNHPDTINAVLRFLDGP